MKQLSIAKRSTRAERSNYSTKGTSDKPWASVLPLWECSAYINIFVQKVQELLGNRYANCDSIEKLHMYQEVSSGNMTFTVYLA